MKRALRLLGGLAAGAVVLVVAAMLALQVALSNGTLSGRIDAALERATGREVTEGGFSVRLGLWPTISVTDAVVANIPGASAAPFARIGRLDVTLGLLALLRGEVEIASLRLADAEITLERDAAGRPNWAFGEDGGGSGGRVSIASIDIVSSRIRPPGGPVAMVGIAALRVARDAPGEPLELNGRLRLDREAVTIDARLGPEAAGVLPLVATITGQGLRVGLRGAWPRESAAPGWTLSVQAEADGAAVARLGRLAGQVPPGIGSVAVSARLGPGAPAPSIDDLTLRLGASDLGGVLPGLAIARAELRAATFDAPATLTAQGRRRGADLGLTATLPSLRQMAGWQAGSSLPLEAVLTTGAARLALSGPLGRDLNLPAAVFDARLTTPDFALLGPVLGVALPRVTGVTARARLSGLAGDTLRLDGLSVAADALAMQGELAIATGARTGFTGRLAAERIDLDALAGPAPPRPRAAGRVIPDIALPLDTLRETDAALRLSAATMVAGGVTWRDVSATVALARGQLAIEPLGLTTPGGPVAGRAVIDATARPPRAELRIDSRGRGLDLAALRRGLGLPVDFDGSAELAFDLRGHGATTRALAASLSGELGVAMVGGRFNGAAALRIGPDLARALLPRGAPAEGLALRCLALRLSAEGGVARSETLLLAGAFGEINGTLAVNLREETIAARLLPDISVMGVTVRAPVSIGGTLAEPRVGVEPGAAVARVIGDTVANRLWRSSTVEFLRGATGSTPPAGDCGPALTLARLGRAGPMPAAAPTPIPLVPREIQGGVHEVFRGIGGLLGGRR